MQDQLAAKAATVAASKKVSANRTRLEEQHALISHRPAQQT
tara:strand:- start:2683 stop:2805 length:123 start_codon:yes stop_codon:yes gene_type:complete